VGPRVGLDFSEKIKIFYPCQNLSPKVHVPICQTIRCHFFLEENIFPIHRRDSIKFKKKICKDKGKLYPITAHEGPEGE